MQSGRGELHTHKIRDQMNLWGVFHGDIKWSYYRQNSGLAIGCLREVHVMAFKCYFGKEGWCWLSQEIEHWLCYVSVWTRMYLPVDTNIHFGVKFYIVLFYTLFIFTFTYKLRHTYFVIIHLSFQLHFIVSFPLSFIFN